MMSEYSQAGESESEAALTPRLDAFEPTEVRGISPGSYVHGQPLHNLPEAEEEEEEDDYKWKSRNGTY